MAVCVLNFDLYRDYGFNGKSLIMCICDKLYQDSVQ